MDTLFEVPVTRDLPCVPTEAVFAEGVAQKAEIEGCGLKVTGIHIVAADQPLRFYIKFKLGQQSYLARGKLEKLGFSVRQKMSGSDLCFYAVKSLVESSWNV